MFTIHTHQISIFDRYILKFSHIDSLTDPKDFIFLLWHTRINTQHRRVHWRKYERLIETRKNIDIITVIIIIQSFQITNVCFLFWGRNFNIYDIDEWNFYNSFYEWRIPCIVIECIGEKITKINKNKQIFWLWRWKLQNRHHVSKIFTYKYCCILHVNVLEGWERVISRMKYFTNDSFNFFLWKKTTVLR